MPEPRPDITVNFLGLARWILARDAVKKALRKIRDKVRRRA